MAIPQIPDLLRAVLAHSADVEAIPDTTPTGQGAFSYRDGWPVITEVELEAGGIAPDRKFFNEIYRLLSGHTFFSQSGNVYPWVGATESFPGLNYLRGAHVLGSDYQEYVAKKPSGPEIPAEGGGFVGPVNPVGDETGVWMPVFNISTVEKNGINRPDGVTIKVDETGKLTVPDVYVRLATDLTLYVATTGNDSNDGLTAATPLRTVQGALNKVSTSYNLGEHTVTISVAEGTYTESVALPKYQASIGLIKIIGAGVDKTVVGGAGSGAMSLSFDAVYIVQSLTLTADKGIGDTPRCLLATSGSITCSNVKFVLPASATGPYPVCIYSYGSGQINLGGNDGLPLILSIASAMAALFAIGGGKITINNPLTITATMLGQCAYAVNSGVISRNQTTMPAISGAVTGARYQSSVNGVINTSGGGASYFPGTIAGSVNMGGQYA